jgi:ribosome-associated protein
MTPMEIVTTAVKALDDKKGHDIQVFKIDELSTLGDYLVIATGNSTTQVRALADEVEDRLTKAGLEPGHIEGRATNWYLLDYFSVMIHVFGKDAREFYNLDRLWADAEKVDISDIVEE